MPCLHHFQRRRWKFYPFFNKWKKEQMTTPLFMVDWFKSCTGQHQLTNWLTINRYLNNISVMAINCVQSCAWFVKGAGKMVNFSNEITKGVFFCLVSSVRQRKKIWVLLRDGTSEFFGSVTWLIYYTLSFLNKLVTRLKKYLLSFDFHLATGWHLQSRESQSSH